MNPAYFIAHGAPTLAIENNPYTQLLQSVASRFPKPKAVLLFTAHWESPVQLIGAPEQFGMIYDFFGFPDDLYRIVYPAQGAPEVAEEARTLLDEAGIPAKIDRGRGLDHGAWVVLRLLFPHADVPVATLSVNPALPPEKQYAIGWALAPLRRDALILGSGGTVHNLWSLDWSREQDGFPADWAQSFDDWLRDRIENWDTRALFRYKSEAPYAHMAVPRNEHFVPLLIAMGSADGNRAARRLCQYYQYGSLSLSCWEFGTGGM
ncbi:dioxygenase [Kyrpidia spormannii]|uniref:Dioxygenase n=1 Tax=Kyrpidia spormannii TaxID=2055160 RepID=A0ACA8Z7I2_9BACL|nr:class III extradiol ring-cleavage dioxygenase [Kyrpidia spormannii]CAB3390903.1 Dioxygenase [Kyrpidia spormannii]